MQSLPWLTSVMFLFHAVVSVGKHYLLSGNKVHVMYHVL